MLRLIIHVIIGSKYYVLTYLVIYLQSEQSRDGKIEWSLWARLEQSLLQQVEQWRGRSWPLSSPPQSAAWSVHNTAPACNETSEMKDWMVQCREVVSTVHYSSLHPPPPQCYSACARSVLLLNTRRVGQVYNSPHTVPMWSPPQSKQSIRIAIQINQSTV